MNDDNAVNRAIAASELAMHVHVIRRTDDRLRESPARLSPYDADLRKRAEEQLLTMDGLQLVRALLDYRRATGIPFKL